MRHHAAVEDDACIRAAVVDGEVVDDRVAADLLFAVAREAQVDRKRVRLDELLRRLQEDEELALVVGDPARIRPLVLDRERERVALPQLERRGRLHVEMPVTENRRGVLGIGRGPDLAERELLLAERRQIGGAADAPDEVADPLARPLHVLAVRRIGAHRGNRQKFTEFVVPGLVHGARLYVRRRVMRRRSFRGSCPHGSLPILLFMRHMSIWAAAVAAATLLGAGCGGASHRALPVVPVTERDFAISAPHLVPAGEVRVVITNKGPVSHELLIVHASSNRLPTNADGFTIDEDAIQRRLVGSVEAAGPGTRDLIVDLTPGRYLIFCNMAGHEASGMLASFVVR